MTTFDHTRPATGHFDRRLAGTLFLAAAVGATAVVPYQLAVAGDAAAEQGLGSAALVAVTVVSGLVLPAFGIIAGMLLGSKVGLGAPLVAGLLDGRPLTGAARRTLGLAAAGGTVTAGLVAAGDLLLAPWLPEVPIGDAGLAVRYLASLYGAVNEELLLRYGLLTALVWAATRVGRVDTPTTGMLWAANLAAAIGFGLLHLPAVAALVELTPLVVIRTLTHNVALGLLFGWLYLRRGLLAAVVAHLAADLVLQTTAWALA